MLWSCGAAMPRPTWFWGIFPKEKAVLSFVEGTSAAGTNHDNTNQQVDTKV
ncbi:MAG: hypothetical protein OEZ05_03585 [Nitrospirota bacterium]|nr:hypothetical protein [Nitrospirota bacterium]MDH5585688.1 hypothetical protein [Nitrospirota bacterium]